MSAADRRSPDVAAFVRPRILVAISALAVLAAARVYAPFVNAGPVLCPMHGLVGLPCPSCGLTRAFCRLAYLDVAGAFGYHALALPLFAACVAAPLICVYELARGRASGIHGVLHSPRVAWSLAAIVITYHATRLSVWAFDGTLVNDYLTTSWTYALLRAMGVAGA